MIKISERAANKVKEILTERGLPETAGLRFAIKGGGCSGFEYVVDLVESPRKFDMPSRHDKVFVDNGTRVLVDKKSLTGFTNREEATVGLTEVVPFLLQSKLEEGGASFSDGGVFAEHVVVDGLLVTGQNPVSSHKAAKSLLALLGKG